MSDLSTLLPLIASVIIISLLLTIWLGRKLGIVTGQVALVSNSLTQLSKSNEDLERAVQSKVNQLLNALTSQPGSV